MLRMFCCILLSRASIILRPLPDLQYLGVLHLSPFGTGVSALGAHARSLVDAFDLLHKPVIARAEPFQRLVAPVWLRLFPPLILHPPFPLSAGREDNLVISIEKLSLYGFALLLDLFVGLPVDKFQFFNLSLETVDGFNLGHDRHFLSFRSFLIPSFHYLLCLVQGEAQDFEFPHQFGLPFLYVVSQVEQLALTLQVQLLLFKRFFLVNFPVGGASDVGNTDPNSDSRLFGACTRFLQSILWYI